MGSGDQEIAAAFWEMLLPGRPDPESKDAEEQEACCDADQAIEERGARLGWAAEPVEALLGATTGRGERLGPQAGTRATI